MGRRIGYVLALVSCVAAQSPTFRARVSVVEIDAQVVGNRGVIEGLQLSDFLVKDNRQPVKLLQCAQEETPLDLVLAFELSKFMAPKRTAMRAAAEMALAALRTGDRVAVMSFEDEVRLDQGFTSDFIELKRRLRIGLAYATFGREPSILPAAHEFAKYMTGRSEPRGRGVVLMITGDAGKGLRNQNHTAVAKDLWEADASLSAMVIPNWLTHMTRDDNPFHFFTLLQMGFNFWDNVDDIAAQTGGEIVSADDEIRPMIRRLRRRYRLYYDMPAGRAGQRRQISVELSPTALALYPDARIVARRGYVIPKSVAQ